MGKDFTSPAILDLTTLLEAFGTINDDLRDTLRWFLRVIGAQLEDIEKRLNGGDMAGAAEVAHSAKGVANTTGALRLGRLCGDIDTALRTGEVALAHEFMTKLPAALSDVRIEIEKVVTAP